MRTDVTQETVPQPSRGRRVSIAFLLSALAPGLGQVYERKAWRGLAMAIGVALFTWLAGEFHLFLTFAGLLGFPLIGIVVRLWTIADAVFLAWRQRPMTSHIRNMQSSVAALIVVFLGIYPTPDFLQKRWAYFHAFKVPSASMCPTICVGDRVVANMEAYKSNGPQRGDVALFERPDITGKLIKRVAAIAGDRVAPGPYGAVLVNGRPYAPQLNPCGRSLPAVVEKPAITSFEPLTVPAGDVFVLGDNLNNSYDSRHFGSVAAATLKGMPLFIYWSSDPSRISCEIH